MTNKSRLQDPKEVELRVMQCLSAPIINDEVYKMPVLVQGEDRLESHTVVEDWVNKKARVRFPGGFFL